MQTIKQQNFCGREFAGEEISLIQEVVATCGSISRHELANTVCELLEWKRPNGRLKSRECSDLLELLESKGALILPKKKRKGKNGSQKIVPKIPYRQPDSTLKGSVEEFAPNPIVYIYNGVPGFGEQYAVLLDKLSIKYNQRRILMCHQCGEKIRALSCKKMWESNKNQATYSFGFFDWRRCTCNETKNHCYK